MYNISNLIRFVFASTLIGISIVVLIMMVFLHAITNEAQNYLIGFLFFIITPFGLGSYLLLKSIKKWRKDKISSLELQLINLAKRQDGIVTISGASTKLNKSIDVVESGFRSLEGRDIFEINANEKGGLEYRLLD